MRVFRYTAALFAMTATVALLAGTQPVSAAGGWSTPGSLPTGASGASQQRYPTLQSNVDGTRVLATWSDFHYKPGSYSDADVVVMASWKTPSGWLPVKEIRMGKNRTDVAGVAVSDDGDTAIVGLTQSKPKGRMNVTRTGGVIVYSHGKWSTPMFLPESNSWGPSIDMAGDGKSAWATWLVDNDAGTGGEKDTDGNARILGSRWNGKTWSDPIVLAETPEGYTLYANLALSGDGSTGAACFTYQSKDIWSKVDDDFTTHTALLRDGSWSAPVQYDVNGVGCGNIRTDSKGKNTWMLVDRVVLNPKDNEDNSTEFNGNSLEVTRLQPDGAWAPPTVLNDNPVVTESPGATLTRIADDGTAFVAWNDDRINGHKQYRVRVSHLKNGAWSKPENILTWTYDRGYTSISLSKNGKHATAAAMKWYKGEPIIRTWTPAGWSKPTQLNKNAGYTPTVTASNTGRAGVAWMTLNCAWNNRPDKYCSDSMKAITAWRN